MTTHTSPAVRAASAPAKKAIVSNKFHIGDCLPVLEGLFAKYGTFADLVYLDPPFNSNRNYNHAFRGGKWTLPQKVAFHDTWEWTEATKKDFAVFIEEASETRAAHFLKAMRAYLEPGKKSERAMLAYLTYITRRLTRIRAVMKPTASVYLHCDQTAAFHLKLAMDAVFGWDNFRNGIAWCYPPKGRGPKFGFHNKHDTIFLYGKAAGGGFFDRPYTELDDYQKGKFSKTDEKGRKYKEYKGKRTYLDESPGRPVPSWWEDIAVAGQSRTEYLGYDTQKPVALMRRIIKASSRPGEVVLDPFCGCGTTIAACHELERQFVGIDVARSSRQVIERRMQTAYPGFGILDVGDETPKNLRGWRKILADADDGAPEWARFQYDAIAAIPKSEQIEGKIQQSARLGADGGVDGLIHLKRPKTGAIVSVVIQVKRHEQVAVSHVAETSAAVDNNHAFMGLLITMHKPTKEMVERGRSSMKQFNGQHYPKVAILTYEEVKAGKFRQAIPHEYAIDPQEGDQTSLNLK